MPVTVVASVSLPVSEPWNHGHGPTRTVIRVRRSATESDCSESRVDSESVGGRLDLEGPATAECTHRQAAACRGTETARCHHDSDAGAG